MENEMDYGKIEKRARIRKNISNIITYALLVFWGILVLFPFYWMLLTSLKSYGAYNPE